MEGSAARSKTIRGGAFLLDPEFKNLHLVCGPSTMLSGNHWSFRKMVDEERLNHWFREEVLPLEGALVRFIGRNWRVAADIPDFRQDIYERALTGARAGLPSHTRHYLFTIARNHLINRAKRAQVVSFELVADIASLEMDVDRFGAERQLNARDELRRAQEGLDRLPLRCREVVWLRKVEGLTTRQTAERLGISIDTVEKQITHGMRALVDFMLGGSGKVRRKPAARSKAGRLER